MCDVDEYPRMSGCQRPEPERKLVVNKNRCDGCLYSAEPVAAHPLSVRNYLRDNEDKIFYCHCSYEPWPNSTPTYEKRVCRGFYEAYPERAPFPLFAAEEPKYTAHWRHTPKGSATSEVDNYKGKL